MGPYAIRMPFVAMQWPRSFGHCSHKTLRQAITNLEKTDGGPSRLIIGPIVLAAGTSAVSSTKSTTSVETRGAELSLNLVNNGV